jgi:coiled-coil domain-containing protein 40
VLTAQHEKLTTTLEETEATLDAARKRAKALKAEEKDADDALGRAREDRRAIDERVLSNLGEQSTVEKGANQTVAATRATRKDIKAAETAVTNLQNDIAKVRVDALNAQTHVAALQETMEALDASLKDKTRTIEKYELEIKRRADEINKRVKDVGRLNLELDKHKGDGDDGENLGPLEATIKSMHKEADATAKENKELQRRWVGHQTELVALVNENNTLTEKTQRLRAERTILERRKTRLDANHERQEGEVRDLDRATEHMRKDTLRINELSAKHLKRKDALLTDNHVLETEIVGELKDLEVAAVELEGKIEAAVEEKRVTLANVVEAERQIMLWERKIQLEKETQAALDPDVGNDVVNAMRKEINRMEHKHGELKRRQEKLIQEMEKAIYKRQLIQTKALSAAARNEGGSSSSSASLKGRAAKKDEMTKAGLKKACAALKKSIRETESGGAEADARIERLEDDGVRAATEARSISHWSPYDPVRVVNADP